MRILTTALLVVLSLAACGGGGGGSSQFTTTWQMGVFQPAANFANKCAAPRMGTDPITHVAYPDRAGSLLDENNFLRSWSNDLYLWYSEITDQNPANFSTTLLYFDVLKTTALTATGSKKDKFHFTYTTSDWEALALTGSSAGYGVQWVILSGTPPRSLVVAYTDPNTPATAVSANLVRGEYVLQVDGIDLVNATTQAQVDMLNAGLFPSAAGQSHTFVIQDHQGVQRTITMVSASVTSTPVQNVHAIGTATGNVGYMLFNDHLATSEKGLYDAFTALAGQNVTDLVIDIRYNGGGYLDIASEVGYMVAGPTTTAGETFELVQFNSKHPSTDPVTGSAIAPTPFLTMSQGFNASLLASGVALPHLDLTRVFVLTGPDTCSASEAVINGLRGAGVTVIQIGSTTCGKPYGFYPQDNCSTTYFSIEFRGVNHVNFGDYTDGFSPQNTQPSSTPTGVLLPGCSIADDFSHQLGDAAEARLAEALSYRANGVCASPASGFGKALHAQVRSPGDGLMPASALRALMIPTRH